MNTLELTKKLKIDFSDSLLCPMIGGNIGKEFEISPEQFLIFAREDFNSNTNRGLINSLTNCKRAIDSAIDKVLLTFDLDLKNHKNIGEDIVRHFKRPTLNLSYKLDLIGALGISTGKLLSDIRIIRHKLEHEYIYPKKSEVEDAIDIAKMFISLIQAKFYLFEVEFKLSDKKNFKGDLSFDNYLNFHFDEEKFQYIITSNLKDQKIIIENTDKEYCALIRLANSVQDEFELTESLKYFLKIIDHPLPIEKAKIVRE